ncbi:MAG: nitroreductase family protein [Bacillota bacterium]|nr:nitroreductase family protein [Bacillota bacterium]
MEAIFKRRSIRKYTDDKLSDGQIKDIIRAGMAAPSCKASCEWVFIVLRDQDDFEKIMENHGYAQALKTASAAVLVCADLEKELEPGEGWWIQDCSAAVENMLIEATDMGIGSLWLGIHPRENRIRFMKELCALPENIEPLALVALGMPQREKAPVDRYLDEQVFDGRYGVKWEKS